MTKEEALRLALEALEYPGPSWIEARQPAITAIKAALANEALERKAENARELGLDYEPWEQFYPEMGKPYGFEASMYSNDRIKVDVVTGNVSIGTVKKPCGLECDCTDVCKQDDYKALWQQMCERCDELDKKLAQLEAKDEPVAWMRTSGTGSPVVTEELLVEMPEMRWNFQQPLYTTPPQRKPLTDEEIRNLWDGHVIPVFGKNGINPIVFARAIEAAHGIKGEA